MLQCKNGLIPKGILTDDELVGYISLDLVQKRDNLFYLNFPCFKNSEYLAFSSLFAHPDERIDSLIYETKKKIRGIFLSCTPRRLESQINQWVSGIVHDLTGMVTEVLISRGILTKPSSNAGIFWCEGSEVEIPSIK